MFDDPSIFLQMLQTLENACEWRCEYYECVAKKKNSNANYGYLNCIIHIAGVSRCLIYVRPCPISLFSFKFGLIFDIHPAFCGNVKLNTNAGELFQTSYNHLQTPYGHFKCQKSAMTFAQSRSSESCQGIHLRGAFGKFFALSISQ